MLASFGNQLQHYRGKAQTLVLAASSSSTTVPSSTRREKPSVGKSLQSGASIPLRPRSHLDKQKRDAVPLTLDPPKAEHSSLLDKMDFDDFIAESDVPILVDFYAPWCGPCQLMSKVVKDISTELKGSMKVVKINTDTYPKLASKYRIKGLPTCLLFRDGSVIDRVDGFMPEPNFGKRVRFYVSRLDTKFGRR